MRTNLFYFVLSVVLFTITLPKGYGQAAQKPAVGKPDSDKLERVQLPKKDSIKPKKVALESKIKRKAKDYEEIDQQNKRITLYNEAEVYYEDVELKSGIIVIDYQKKEVYAGRIKDSTGKYIQRPTFKQGGNVVEPDSIRFNYETKKAKVWNSRTEQGEMHIKAALSKRENDSTYFMKNTRFTTAEDVDNPEYYFQTNRVKLVPKKKIITGFTYMVIADVPTPLSLPFAFFPITTTNRSGIIAPTYNDSRQRGFALQNGGYYFALSDHYDLAVLGDYYTNGSYALRFDTHYANRYKFSGNFNFRYENLINSERGYPDYSKSTIYNIQWSHARDSKANPSARFSASVNLGSSTYYQQSLNQINTGARLNNTLNSSVSFSKTFATVPQINLSLSATHSQNTQTKEINMTLPTLQASVDRIYLFGNSGSRRGAINNLNLQYNLRGENRINTVDSLFFKPKMFQDANIGFQHSIPLSTNFKLLKYFSVSPSLTYQEVWYFKTLHRGFDEIQNKVVDSQVRGVDAFRTYSFSSSVGTTIYGTFSFGNDKKIQAIRHVMRPSASWSYTPSFDQYYDTYATDASGKMRKDYTRFEGGMFGAPGNSYSNSLGFSMSNTFEAKVRDEDPKKTEPKKVMLLNNLNLSTSYNLAADSLRWSPMRVSTGTLLFKQKMNINVAATLDPYAINRNGTRLDKFNIDNGGSLFRMTSANLTMNYTVTPGSDSDKKKDTQTGQNGGRPDDLFGRATDLGDNQKSLFDDKAKTDSKDVPAFYSHHFPVSLTLAYSVTYSNNNRENKVTSNSIMATTNIDLSSKWKVGISSGYDFANKGVTYTQLRFERDLLSWRMSLNWVPIGDYANWGFFIGIKSGVLSDIKWDKRSLPDKVIR
ncbi:MAG: organic solvent tolerance protein OstA [Flavobacterium sp. BFFFF2]|nr:MAG: organic solvent tolerance protein OstA [Flavobacterium sp. BFFFF2]